jgi:hypothetical protein
VSWLILTHTSSSTRVVFQTKVVYQAKFFASKQDVYQVGLIPKRTYTEVPLYNKWRDLPLNSHQQILQQYLNNNFNYAFRCCSASASVMPDWLTSVQNAKRFTLYIEESNNWLNIISLQEQSPFKVTYRWNAQCIIGLVQFSSLITGAIIILSELFSTSWLLSSTQSPKKRLQKLGKLLTQLLLVKKKKNVYQMTKIPNYGAVVESQGKSRSTATVSVPRWTLFIQEQQSEPLTFEVRLTESYFLNPLIARSWSSKLLLVLASTILFPGPVGTHDRISVRSKPVCVFGNGVSSSTKRGGWSFWEGATFVAP